MKSLCLQFLQNQPQVMDLILACCRAVLLCRMGVQISNAVRSWSTKPYRQVLRSKWAFQSRAYLSGILLGRVSLSGVSEYVSRRQSAVTREIFLNSDDLDKLLSGKEYLKWGSDDCSVFLNGIQNFLCIIICWTWVLKISCWSCEISKQVACRLNILVDQGLAVEREVFMPATPW